MPLVRDPNQIKIGIAGKVDENDHPYSWSAILNGYDPSAMLEFADPMISKYLSAQPKEKFGFPGVKVTHIWCDDPLDANRIARASHIPTIVAHCEDLIGYVDAVLIPTDRGDEHVRRARPFVEANIPVFIDKPLCDNLVDLAQFEDWISHGAAIHSSSAMRYSVEFAKVRQDLPALGELRLLSISMAKSWRRYGIHAIEGVYPFLSPGGWLSLTNTGRSGAEIVHLQHAIGVDTLVTVVEDALGGFGVLMCYGTKGHCITQFRDSFSAFAAQLQAFIEYLRTGQRPFPFGETSELIRILVAGEKSREQDGKRFFIH